MVAILATFIPLTQVATAYADDPPIQDGSKTTPKPPPAPPPADKGVVDTIIDTILTILN